VTYREGWWRLTRDVEADEELLVYSYGRDFWQGSDGDSGGGSGGGSGSGSGGSGGSGDTDGDGNSGDGPPADGDGGSGGATSSTSATLEHIAQTQAVYAQDYLAAQERDYLAWCRALAEQGKFQRYEQNMPGYSFMVAGPKLEWYLCDERGWRCKYGWGQTPRFWQAGYPMEPEPLLMALVRRIKEDFGEDVNHAILKWYADGLEQSSPPHQDKAEGVDGATAAKCDMASDASFYIFSFHEESTFEFFLQRGRGVPDATGNKEKLKPSDVVWQKALASGSLLKVSAQDNRTYFHALHKKKGAKERFSLIFRVIKTSIPIDAAAADEVNSDRYRFVSKAQVAAGRVRPTADDLKIAAQADAEAAAARAADAGTPWSSEPTRKEHNHNAKSAYSGDAEETPMESD